MAALAVSAQRIASRRRAFPAAIYLLRPGGSGKRSTAPPAESFRVRLIHSQQVTEAAAILVAVLSPVILLIALLCSVGTAGAEHNSQAVRASFYGMSCLEEVPAEFRHHIEEIQTAFSLLDSAVSSANGQMDSGNSLDPIRVKAVFYALCFGEDAPSTRAANRFVECFYTTETRTRTVEVVNEDGTVTTEEETYTVAVPFSLRQVYINLEGWLGRAITEDDRSNANHIYTMITGTAGGDSYNGEYLRGDGSSVEIDISTFTDTATKNAADLVTYAINAHENGWGYVWGTYGNVLSESLFAYKLEQYPDGVGNYADFIRTNWLGGRTTDCVGLIKGYGWLNPETLTIDYGTNGMPDIGANRMYYSASTSGPIDILMRHSGASLPKLNCWNFWLLRHICKFLSTKQRNAVIMKAIMKIWSSLSMKKLLFICHGNICRSPMAEFVMKDLVKKAGLESQFHIASAATSREELGNPVYPPARRKLAEHGISCEGHAARQLTNQDYDAYDLLIGMDSANLRNMYRICGGDYAGKMSPLMDHTDHPGDVADPWYTGDFEATWRDVLEGCQELLKELIEK